MNILIVQDEFEDMVEALKWSLENLLAEEYDVQTSLARSAQEAFDFYCARSNELDLLIVDVTLPPTRWDRLFAQAVIDSRKAWACPEFVSKAEGLRLTLAMADLERQRTGNPKAMLGVPVLYMAYWENERDSHASLAATHLSYTYAWLDKPHTGAQFQQAVLDLLKYAKIVFDSR